VNAILFAVSLALVAPQEPQIPASRGHLNDFAGVVDAARAARIERIAAYVRAQSRGEIAIVTMRDIGERAVNDIALRIGREWGVGANAPVGDRARNAGVVILLVPKETSSNGRGQIAVEVGQGAEGFISDGTAGDIWRSTIPLLQQSQYGAALEAITYRVAERYANEFGFSMDSIAASAPRTPPQPTRGQPRNVSRPVSIVFVVVMIIIISAMSRGGRGRGGRGRGGGLGSALPWIILSQMSNRGGSRGGWGGGFGGGGGGGGFGGFGGGGGFSGGGSSGSW
jgi:uncharacterized protein